MATIVSNNNKYSLKFSASDGTGSETTVRTISGLNIGPGSAGDTGPLAGTALSFFIPRFVAFSQGTFSNWRWVTEQEVDV